MSKIASLALLLCCSPVVRSQTFQEQVWQEMQQSIDQMHKRFDAIEKYMNQSFSFFEQEQKQEQVQSSQEQAQTKEPAQKQVQAQPTQKVIEITSDNNFVTIKLHLGELDAKEIDINAEKNNLDGKIPLKNGSANFSIQSGRLFNLSMNSTHKKEEKNEKEKVSSYSFASSAASKIESLPDVVADLENTQVSYKDGVVELKLPKMNAQKHGTKINVIGA